MSSSKTIARGGAHEAEAVARGGAEVSGGVSGIRSLRLSV